MAYLEANQYTNAKKDFDAICEYHKLKSGLRSEEVKVLDEMTDGADSIDDALLLFKNSLSLAWIDHIESTGICFSETTAFQQLSFHFLLPVSILRYHKRRPAREK